MARFSLIVPSAGDVSSFEETLASILRYRPENAQVLVVHGGDYEDRYGLGREVDFIGVDTVKGDHLIELFNAGVKEARGQWIGFLRPGIQLTENWERAVESAFLTADVACVSPLIVSASNLNRVLVSGVSAGAGFTRVLTNENQRLGSKSDFKALGPTSWGAFYRRSILVALDECDTSLGANYFDLDLALSFATLGFRNVITQDCFLTCANREAKELFQDADSPHGCAAQRAAIRFGAVVDVPPALSTTSALVRDVLTWPWQWRNLAHLNQRKQAAQFRKIDEHYRRLLELLKDQRSRLVSPGLHARVAAHQRNSSLAQRRAA